MNKQAKATFALILAFLALSGCGQKGPLFLPGNPSEVRPVPEQEQVEADRDEGDEEERVRVP